jgi:hypothetical protein
MPDSGDITQLPGIVFLSRTAVSLGLVLHRISCPPLKDVSQNLLDTEDGSDLDLKPSTITV